MHSHRDLPNSTPVYFKVQKQVVRSEISIIALHILETAFSTQLF